MREVVALNKASAAVEVEVVCEAMVCPPTNCTDPVIILYLYFVFVFCICVPICI